MLEEPGFDIGYFPLCFASVATDAVCANDSVAGNDDGDRIATTGLSYCAWAALQFIGKLSIGEGAANWNHGESMPHALLKGGTLWL